MTFTGKVLAENCSTRDGIEYVTVTALESGMTPLLQMCDYTLRREEMTHKGKLLSKEIAVQVESIRSIFGGRPQLVGKLTVLK